MKCTMSANTRVDDVWHRLGYRCHLLNSVTYASAIKISVHGQVGDVTHIEEEDELPHAISVMYTYDLGHYYLYVGH